MKDSIEVINLTDDILNNLKTENFIAITIAEGGAMGDPGAIEIVDKKLKLYRTHFGEIDDKLLREKIPFLNTLQIGFGNIDGLDKGWAGLYTGYGNYLFVRPKYKKPIEKYIEKNYGDSEVGPIVELYSHWYEALTEIAGKKNTDSPT